MFTNRSTETGKNVTFGKSLFLFAWCILITYSLLVDNSEFVFIVSKELKRIVYIIVEFILFFKIIKYDRFRKNILFLLFLLALIISIVSVESKTSILILYLSIIIAGKNVDLRSFVKTDMAIRFIIFCILFILSITGVIKNYSAEINGTIKNGFGWIHPNTTAGILLLVLLEWMYIHWHKFTLKRWIITIVAVIFLFEYAAARTTLYAFALICIWSIIIRRNKSFNTKYKSIGIIYTLAYPICAGLSFFLMHIYSEGDIFGLVLNEMLTGRLAAATNFMNEYGLAIWGQSIETVSTRQSIISGASALILDMAYIRLGIEYGVIYMTLFILSFMYLSWKLYKYNYLPELMLVLYFSIVGIASTSTINFFMNYTLIFIWLIYKQNKCYGT